MKSLFTLLFSLLSIFAVASETSPIPVMTPASKIYVAGHNGLVGRAIVRYLENQGFHNIVTRSSSELDLRDSTATRAFFEEERPEFVFLAAAKVGGIGANSTYPADFIYDNLMIETNVIHAAFLYNVKKLLFLGSSCIYPRLAPQPIKEEYLLTGLLEPTNDAYAIAKIAGILMCQSYNKQHKTRFISCMPTNLYGPYDNFDLKSSHVLPALIRKFSDAKEKGLESVTLWGTGSALREFLHVDDLASAAFFLMQHYEENQTINVGCGEDLSIKDLAALIRSTVGYEGEICFDAKGPDGTPKKLLDISKLKALGWEPQISLEEGIRSTVDWYLENKDKE